MIEPENSLSPASQICRSCGLCCNGQLFIWAKLRPAELDPAESLGMSVFRSDPTQRGFSQPCPLWQGVCTIYTSRHYPHACRAYKCKLLKEVIAESMSLQSAFNLVEQAKTMIGDLEVFLPNRPTINFRERLVARLEHPQDFAELKASEAEFQSKAAALLAFYEQVFGVNDLLENHSDSY